MRRVSMVFLVIGMLAGCSGSSSTGTEGSGASSSTSSSSTTTTTVPSTVPPTPSPFAGWGTWVDAFDYSPAYQETGEGVSVTPADVDAMADAGVRTLYLQAAKDDPRSTGDLVHDTLVAQFLTRAHARGMQVVAWFLPLHVDTAGDLRRFEAMTNFEVDGRGFDGYALDIEWVEGVPDHTARNAELLELTEGARAAAGDSPLAAIVFSPVATEVVNPAVWPEFPWTEIATFYDVWMPMAYWTFRDGSAYRDPYVYATESVERLRANLDDPDAAVHPIGGIADESTADDYTVFLRARDAVGAIGWSVYDWDTTATGARSALVSPRR